MVTLLTVIHITVCLFLILVVLLQAGKGGGMGIAFGGTGSQTVFGSSGAGNFLTRLTSIIATVFLVTSLALAYYSSRQDSKRLQELSSQKAAEKKTENEKTAKLKAEMEKIRAAAAIGKDAGAAGNLPEGAAGTPAQPPMIPLKLKLPGGPADNGTTVPVGAKPSAEAPANKTATPAMKKVAPPLRESTAPTAPTTAGESAPPRADQAAPKPAVRRRRPVAPVAAPTPGESQPAPVPAPEKAPAAPAAPAE